jgi:hypothetical protein
MKYYSLGNIVLVAICNEYDYIATLSSGYINSGALSQNTLLKRVMEIEGQAIQQTTFESLINTPSSSGSAKELSNYFKVIEENGNIS